MSKRLDFNEVPEKLIIIPETPEKADFRIESSIKGLSPNDSISSVIPLAADKIPEPTEAIQKKIRIMKRLNFSFVRKTTFI